MRVKVLLLWLIDQWGDWFNHDVYYRLRIHSMPRWKRIGLRAAYFPKALAVRLRSVMQKTYELARVETAITTRCTLRCRDCSNLIVFYDKRADIDTQRIMKDIEDLLCAVDRIHRFIVMGGEPLLHSGLKDILSYLLSHSGVGVVQVITNGTVIPDNNLLALFQHPKMLVTVSNYSSDIAKNKSRLLSLLKDHQINYSHEPDFQWIDLGGWDPQVDDTPQALRHRYQTCPRKACHNMFNGQYHLCPRSAHGMKLGQIADDAKYYVVLRDRSDPLVARDELNHLFQVEYINACSRCRGQEGSIIPPAVQVEPGQRAKAISNITLVPGHNIGGGCEAASG